MKIKFERDLFMEKFIDCPFLKHLGGQRPH